MDVDTRVLRYFVAVAEHRSFTQAARATFVAQPSLSRQIKQLESRFGADLFTRTSSEVRLTAAGEVLLEAARRQLADWQDTVRRVRAAAAAAGWVLRVGFVATSGGALTRRAGAVLAARSPHATVEPTRCDWDSETQALRDGLVDVAFVWLPADTSGLHTETVGTEPRFVGMSSTHPLARQREVRVDDLRDEPLPLADNVEETLEQVATTTAVCVGPESMGSCYPDLTWRPLADVEPLRIALAWPHGTANPLVGDFVQVVRGLTCDAGHRAE